MTTNVESDTPFTYYWVDLYLLIGQAKRRDPALFDTVRNQMQRHPPICHNFDKLGKIPDPNKPPNAKPTSHDPPET